MTAKIRKELRENTMACWWPSAINPMKSPDWLNMAGELHSAAENAVICRGDYTEARQLMELAEEAIIAGGR